MNKKTLIEIKNKLIDKKERIEQQLQKFAHKSSSEKDVWDTKFPKFDDNADQVLEDQANEVEEYVSNLSIEHSLENLLRDINYALKKIEKGEYGKCENCKKEIPLERLKAIPEVKNCGKCGNF